MSASRMQEFGAMVVKRLADLERSCAHRQAEPIILRTGERVACICIACYGQLPADWIQWQLRDARIEAYCAHGNEVDATAFGERHVTLLCIGCGRRRTE